jgi:hypothetical protein
MTSTTLPAQLVLTEIAAAATRDKYPNVTSIRHVLLVGTSPSWHQGGKLYALLLTHAMYALLLTHPMYVCRYADGDKVALNVGFYYMANAMGRFTGVS